MLLALVALMVQPKARGERLRNEPVVQAQLGERVSRREAPQVRRAMRLAEAGSARPPAEPAARLRCGLPLRELWQLRLWRSRWLCLPVSNRRVHRRLLHGGLSVLRLGQ